MKWSFTIGKIFGIRIRIHWIFVIMVAGLALRFLVGGGSLEAFQFLAFLTILFAFVLLHELGHSLMALRLGVRVIDITLWPLGGIARLGRIPENPTTELAIAVAGPGVNILAAALLAPLALAGQTDLWSELISLHYSTPLNFCILVNVAMAVFNFIPAFPLDGGRVLRGILGYRMDFLRATRIAVRVGRVFAILFVAIGVLFPEQFLMLVFIGIFILITGGHEERSVRWRSLLERASREGIVMTDDSQTVGEVEEAVPIDLLREILESGDLDRLREIVVRGIRRPPPDDRGSPG